MRKAMTLTLLLLIVSVAGVAFAAAGVYEARDQVTLTEKAVYGDLSAADGLTVLHRAFYDQHLFWDTTHVFGEEPVTETAYDFSAAGRYDSYAAAYSGVDLSSSPFDAVYFDPEVPQTGLGVAYEELYAQTGPGEEREKEIYLKDYVDYYPITVELDLPGTWVRSWPYERPADAGEPGTERYAVWTIQEYFKIPVQEDERYRISVHRDGSGRHTGGGGGTTGSDFFHTGTVSALTDEACYFTFDTRTSDGKVVDTSQLPEGYGIFRLPYQEVRHDESGQRVCGADADGLDMVYPLDPETVVHSIGVDPEQTRLLLHASEGGKYVLTVIDIETMETLQRLEIADLPEDSGCSVYDGGGFLTATFDGRLAVVEAAESGYELRYVCELWPEGVDTFSTWRAVMDFDGERLAVVGPVGDVAHHNGDYYVHEAVCGFYVAIYEETGLAYCGEYRSSLNTGRDLEDYNYYCRNRDNAPLTVTWSAE